MAHQEGQLLIAPLVLQLHRRGKFAKQRRDRLEVNVVENKSLLRLGDVQHVMHRVTALLQRDYLAFVIVQFDVERNMQRLLLRLLSGRRRALADGQHVLLRFRVVVIMDGDNRRTGLAIPAAEVGQIDVGSVFHRLDKVVAGRGAAVVALKIELHAFLEILFAQQGMQHADHFRSLFIHCQGIEVVHLNHAIRANRMRHRAGVFGKLQAAHGAYVIDAVDRTRAEVGAEFLIAENGQPLFQAELEPVAAGHAIAGPVMEIFMTNHALDIQVIFIGRGIGTRQYVFGVKDVKAFVFHGAHVEEVDGDNHIDVEVVL